MPTAANTPPPEHPAPVRPADVRPAPVRPAPVRPAPVRPAEPLDPPEPRWPAYSAAVAVAVLYLALPGSLAVGPRWLFPVLIVGLVTWTTAAHHVGRPGLNHVLGLTSTGVLTAFVLWSLALLIRAMLYKTEDPMAMLRSGVALWVGNVLTFALWYWRLDGGGPNARDKTPGHKQGSFLFPQMTSPDLSHPPGGPAWSPQFVDYLFLAFNTSTAFSPTDAPVLGRWAKVLTMTQSSVSLAVVALLVARGVNVL